MKIQEFLDRLNGVRRTANGWTALCPAHDDRHPSLSVCEGAEGRVLVFCFAGCSLEEILKAVGLRVRDLFEGSSHRECERQTARAARRQENLKKRREGLRADLMREAQKLLETAGGIDSSSWTDDRLDRELNRLADAYEMLEMELGHER